MNSAREKKLVIIVLGFNPERTIPSVLARLPLAELPRQAEALVIAEAPEETIGESILAGAGLPPGLKVSIMSSPARLGRGYDLKLGFQYAIENGANAVAVLDAEGVFPPEKLPALVTPILDGVLHMSLAARSIEQGREAEMSRLERVGAAIAAFVQNEALGLRFSEFHAGYRAYSVEALKQVPFRLNANGPHFDTEILIQFVLRGFKAKEFAIPRSAFGAGRAETRIRFFWNAAKSLLAARMHAMGLAYCRKFDVAGERFKYDVKLGYPSSHTLAIAAVQPRSTVLDLACGEALVAKELNAKGCRVTGVDRIHPRANFLDRFILQDLDNAALPANIGAFDYILALDCLEHLDAPENLLRELRSKCFSERTILIFTAPNIGFFATRLALLFGRFNYTRQGILDITHKKFYTFRTFRRLLVEEDYEIVAVRGVPAPFPKLFGDNGFSTFLVNLNRALILALRGLFAYQIYVEARFLPPLDRMVVRKVEIPSKPAPTDGQPGAEGETDSESGKLRIGRVRPY